MKPLDKNVSIEQEAEAIVDFVNKTWTPIDNLDHIVNSIITVVKHDVRALFDGYMISEHARKLEDLRKEKISAAFPPGIKQIRACLYDDCCHLLSEISSYANRVREESLNRVREESLNIDGEWYFTNKTSPLHKKLITEFPILEQARPLGWDALSENYKDFDGQEKYDPTSDLNLFKGSNIQSRGAPDITGRIALPYVMYDDKCQGRNPSYTLVSSIYAHFMGFIQ